MKTRLYPAIRIQSKIEERWRFQREKIEGPLDVLPTSIPRMVRARGLDRISMGLAEGAVGDWSDSHRCAVATEPRQPRRWQSPWP